MTNGRIPIARIGRAVGLRGEMKLNLLTDFPEQFKKDAVFKSDRGDLIIKSFNHKRMVVTFAGIDNVEDAKSLTNSYLYSDEKNTLLHCKLGKDEYFWFQIFGLDVIENGEKLGHVEDIDRLNGTDYLRVITDQKLIDAGLPKSFLIPYVSRYIKDVNLEAKILQTEGAKEILEAS